MSDVGYFPPGALRSAIQAIAAGDPGPHAGFSAWKGPGGASLPGCPGRRDAPRSPPAIPAREAQPAAAAGGICGPVRTDSTAPLTDTRELRATAPEVRPRTGQRAAVGQAGRRRTAARRRAAGHPASSERAIGPGTEAALARQQAQSTGPRPVTGPAAHTPHPCYLLRGDRSQTKKD